jgi:antitoxin VapB
MVKQLNIKSDALYGKVERLAELTGTSLTGAVEAAVEERLSRAQREMNLEVRLQRVRDRTVQICANLTGPSITSADADKLLYDDDGLPIGAWPHGD